MVVTRRAPAPPVPTTRSNSAQPIPRVKGKAPHTVPDVPSPLSNGASRAGPNVEGSDTDPKNDVVRLILPVCVRMSHATPGRRKEGQGEAEREA